MKNKIIFILIFFMLVALIGLIIIQVQWIDNAAEKRKEVLRYQVHDALSTVNTELSKKENLDFIQARFGGLDSLYEEVLVEEIKQGEEQKHNKVVVIENRDSLNNLRIEYSSRFETDSMIESLDEWEGLENKIQIKVKNELQSISKWQGKLDDKVKEVSEIVQHFAFEKLSSGKLEDRIQVNELDQSIEKALEEQGISSAYAWVVFNEKQSKVVDAYVVGNLNRNSNTYSTYLFPQDQLDQNKYQLKLQLKNEDQFVWKGIQNMVYLSIVFTVLIILCFAYALHFIFKQKRMAKVKSDLINNMSHELKTPLASIALASASIKHPEVMKDPKEIERMLGVIDEERGKMNAHIEKVLDMAAADEGKFQVQKEIVLLDDLIQSVLKHVNRKVEELDAEVTADLQESVSIQADPFHLKNALTNIIDNSLKYSDQKPKIKVVTQKEGDHILIRVEDDGIGMSAKTQKKAFDAFYRAETGDIHNRKGFGLGLSYVKEVIAAHRGEINLESKLGQGTTLTIKLPTNV